MSRQMYRLISISSFKQGSINCLLLGVVWECKSSLKMTVLYQSNFSLYSSRFVLYHFLKLSSAQSLSAVWLCMTPWTAARQASLSITNSQSLFRLLPITSVTPSSHLMLCSLLLLVPSVFPRTRVLSNELGLHISGQSIGVSASASVFPMNIQHWFPLGWTGWISLKSKGLSRVFSDTTVQKHQFFSAQFLYSPTLTSIHDYWKNHSLD